MSSTHSQNLVENEYYLVAHVATTCDEHGVYVTKDSAEVIELGWLLLDLKSLDEVSTFPSSAIRDLSCSLLVSNRYTAKVSS